MGSWPEGFALRSFYCLALFLRQSEALCPDMRSPLMPYCWEYYNLLILLIKLFFLSEKPALHKAAAKLIALEKPAESSMSWK